MSHPVGIHSVNQASRPPRLTVRRFFGELTDELLSLDRGMWHTFAGLCIRPGATIMRWVGDRDARLTRPSRYFLVLVTLSLLMDWVFDPAPLASVLEASQVQQRIDALSNRVAADSWLSVGQAWAATGMLLLSKQRDWLFLLLVPFLAIGMRAGFRTRDINYAEHWVAATYAFAHAYFLQNAVELIGLHLLPDHMPMVTDVSLLLGAAVLTWILARFAEPGSLMAYVRALAALFLGLVTFFVTSAFGMLAYLRWIAHA